MSCAFSTGFIIAAANFITIAVAVPLLRHGQEKSEENNVWNNSIFIYFVCLALLGSLLPFVIACACCKRRQKFKLQSFALTEEECGSVGGGYPINSLPSSDLANGIGDSSSQIYFEPLPDLHNFIREQSASAASQASIKNEDWFAEPFQNFPRNQLQYVRLMGTGWFGQVLEGRALGIGTDHTLSTVGPNSKSGSSSTSVVVRSLREDATLQEQEHFLQEVRPFRDLTHPNVVKILAYCLEQHPLLLLMEMCHKGDLKGVLIREPLPEKTLLKMCVDVCTGLEHMNLNKFIAADLAARNCLVNSDNSVKIGDFGFTLELYQSEYYQSEGVLLPLRWCAPESLICTQTTIQSKQLNESSNAWSLGVVLWEILSQGELPYADVDDEEVVQTVILKGSKRLHLPYCKMPQFREQMEQILSFCWLTENERPPVQIILNLMKHLYETVSLDPSQMEDLNHPSANLDFEERWSQLCPSLDNSNNSGTEFQMSTENNDSLEARVAAKFGNSRPSWLGLNDGQQMDSLTAEISEAIMRLDEALAEEISEESSSCTTSPEKSEGLSSFIVGRDSHVSNPPTPGSASSLGCISTQEGAHEEEERLTKRVEAGDFSELVRLKSQSVQNLMKLTVVDPPSENNSQNPSLIDTSQSFPLTVSERSGSEGSLIESLRDPTFMRELSRLKEGGLYSIISEMSKEDAPSLELRINLISTCDFDDENGLDKCRQMIQEKDPANKYGIFSTPDCIISSIESKSLPLPDIVTQNIRAFSPTRDSVLDNDSFEMPHSYVSDFESREKPYKYSSDTCLDVSLSSPVSSGGPSTPMCSSPKFKYIPENVVQGNDVIFGALDDYSLEIYKPAKSSVLTENVMHRSDISLDEEEEIFYPQISEEDRQKLKSKSSISSFDKFGNNVREFSASNDSQPWLPTNQQEIMQITNNDGDISKVNKPKTSLINDNNGDDSCSLLYNSDVDKSDSISNVIELETGLITPDKCGVGQNDNQLLNPNEFLSDNAQDYCKVQSFVNDEKFSNPAKQDLFDKVDNQNRVRNIDLLTMSINHVNDSSVGNMNLAIESKTPESLLTRENIAIELSSNDRRRDSEIVGTSISRSSDQFKEASILEDSIPFKINNYLLNTDVTDSGCHFTEEIRKDSINDGPNTSAVAFTEDINSEISCNDIEFRIKNPVLDDTSDKPESKLNILEHRWSNISAESETMSEDSLQKDEPQREVFWQQQMEAWQEAAMETKNLLQRAAMDSGQSDSPFSQNPMENDDCSSFTSSNLSTPGISPSTGLDEPTYISYDDEKYEDVQYTVEDIDVLRRELLLTLGNSPKNEEEDEIEQTSSMTRCSTLPRSLSPIREESLSPEPAQVDEGSLVIVDLEGDSTPIFIPKIEPISPMANEEVLMVNTVTNEAAIIAPNRSGTILAFVTSDENNELGSSQGQSEINVDYEEDLDDVSLESLPYDVDKKKPPQKSSIESVSDSAYFSANQNQHHYQSYFMHSNSSFQNFHSLPTSVSDDNDGIALAAPFSLPYDVNYALSTEIASNNKGNNLPQSNSNTSDEITSDLSTSNNFKSLKLEIEDPLADERSSTSTESKLAELSPSPNSEISALKFLGSLYGESVGEAKVESSQSLFSSSNRDSALNEEEVEEKCAPEIPKEKDTPIITPSDLKDIKWRPEVDKDTPSEANESDGVCYTPDWEEVEDDDIDEDEEDDASSTSGEFVWHPYGAPSENLDQQKSPSVESEGSVSGEEDFTPSTWNRELTPLRSLLKSPLVASPYKKSVQWKRQRHHRVYEYPPEPQSWHGVEHLSQSGRRMWGHPKELLAMQDWDRTKITDDFVLDGHGDFAAYTYPQHLASLSHGVLPSKGQNPYALPIDDEQEGLYDNSEFFIRSTGAGFPFTHSSFSPGDFFSTPNAEKSGEIPPSKDKLRLDLNVFAPEECTTPTMNNEINVKDDINDNGS